MYNDRDYNEGSESDRKCDAFNVVSIPFDTSDHHRRDSDRILS